MSLTNVSFFRRGYTSHWSTYTSICGVYDGFAGIYADLLETQNGGAQNMLL